MITPPLLTLYEKWLRQGTSFNFMAQVCRYFMYTHKAAAVDFYGVQDDEIALAVGFPVEKVDATSIHLRSHRDMPASEWYTLGGSDGIYFLNVRVDDRLIGVYKVRSLTAEQVKRIPIIDWLIAAIQWGHERRGAMSEEWAFAKESADRWMVVTPKGVVWYNTSVSPWFTPGDKDNNWPSWVHKDAVVCSNVFWDQMRTKKFWSGMVIGGQEHPTTWWNIQSLKDEQYLVRVHTYEELTTNLLAQSHWQRHDPLTALPREAQMQWHWKSMDIEVWNIVLVSLDNFYSLNAQYGAECVDKGLLEIAATLRERLPYGWSLWRGRAEQFYAMGPGNDKEWLIPVLRLEVDDNQLKEITTSVGIGTDASYSNAKKLAMEAVQQAQSKGGQQLVINTTNKRIRCPSSMREALEQLNVDKELQLVYDPIYKDGVVGFRIHSNWLHPVWGVIKGEEFFSHCDDATLQEYMYWTVQQLITKANEWIMLGLEKTKILWPLPSNIWTNPKVHSIIVRDWTATADQSLDKVLEIDESDALQHFDLLLRLKEQWASKKIKLCISLRHSDNINILKLLQLHPEYILLPWPFARSVPLHKVVNEVISFILHRRIEVFSYCPHGVGAPKIFSGSIQQKPYH